MSKILEYVYIVDSIYGVYLDSVSGFREVLKRFEESQMNTLRSFKKTHPELATIEHLDSTAMFYGRGDPNSPESKFLHRTTQKKFKERNRKNGPNHMFIGNMALVTLYQYWEDQYREQIAKELGLKKKELLVPVFGDIRILRHSIVHHEARALPDVTRCELLQWFEPGDQIHLTNDQFETLIFEIKQALDSLAGYQSNT